MDAPLDGNRDEVAQLTCHFDDLVRIMALSVPDGLGPPQIVSTFVEPLLEMLRLTFVYVRLNGSEGALATTMAWIADGAPCAAAEITDAMTSVFEGAPHTWPARAHATIRAVSVSIACAHFDPHGELGSLIAGAERTDFPTRVERLLLDVAASQATVALQRAHLHESERKARLLLDSIPGQVSVLEPTGKVAIVNRHILEYSGRTLEELQRWGTTDTVHVEDLPHVVSTFTQSVASGRPYEILQRLRRFDGAYRWFRNSGFPRRDSAGNIVEWCVLLTDIDDQKRAEENIRAREHQLKLIIDTIPAMAWSAHPDGRADFFNQHYLDYMGVSAEEAAGWGWTAAVHPDDWSDLAETWQAIMMSKEPGDAEARLRRHDGEYRWFLFRANPLRDEAGNIVKWYGVNTDIEDRKRAEHGLRRSETFLVQAQRLTLTGSLWWDVASGAITWSEQSYRLFEYPTTISPTVGLILARVHPEDVSLVQTTIGRAASEGTNIDLEHRLRMPDGSVKHVHVVVQRVAVESSTLQFVGAATDITERKRAEAELRRAYHHLSEAQRLSQTGSFTADLDRDEHFWSDELYRICDFDQGTPVSLQKLAEVVHPDDTALYVGAIERVLAGADPDFQFRIVTARGVTKHLRGVAHRIGSRQVFVGAVQDVTASKLAQEAMNRAASELAHVSRVTTVSALTASIAHEVNQPLSGIITNASTCLRMLDAEHPDLEAARNTVRRTIRDANRAADVVARLRALFSKREFTLEPLDLNEALREVIALSSSELQKGRIIVRAELAADLPIVKGDRIQIQQVILNLVRNASDAMAEVHERRRQLLIKTAREEGDHVRLDVCDAGVGLAAQFLDSMFDAFYTTKSGGMGIGLFVSRSIVERHQGRLWAEPNSSGPGATFAFSIPCTPKRGFDVAR